MLETELLGEYLGLRSPVGYRPGLLEHEHVDLSSDQGLSDEVLTLLVGPEPTPDIPRDDIER